MQSSSGKIGFVNGLRGIAIAMVVWHHLYGQHFSMPGMTDLPEWHGPLYVLAVSGWLGVNVFFVLSGFVLYLPFAEETRSFDARRFLIRRSIRILPLYYVNVALCLGFMLWFEPVARVMQHAAIYAVAALPSPVLFFPPYNPPLWSLGIEIWFSVIFPAFVLFLRHFAFMRIFLVVLLLSLAVHMAGMFVAREAGSYLNPISDTLPGRLSDFAIGMYAAVLWKTARFSPARGRALTAAGFLLLALALTGSEAWFRGALPGWTQTFWNLSLAGGVAALLVGLRDASPNSFLRMALEFWPLQIIGLMCFSIYIWHWQLIELFSWASGGSAWMSNLGSVSAYLALLLAIGAVSYWFIEFPGERGLRSLLGLRRTKEPACSATPRRR